mgnify:CR=1 FL=1
MKRNYTWKSWDETTLHISNLAYEISPGTAQPVADIRRTVHECLDGPIAAASLRTTVSPSTRVLILADDVTRPTPQKLLIPPLIEYLTNAGVPGKNITLLVALGSHRKMRDEELRGHYGEYVLQNVVLKNHDYDDPEQLTYMGTTDDGTPIHVNRLLREADVTIGVSSILPHAQVGWGGGGKIVLPGTAGEDTVAHMHRIAAEQPDYPFYAGRMENPARAIIDKVAGEAGLGFILNAVIDSRHRVVQVVAGDPQEAHREGRKLSSRLYIRPIPEKSDITIVDCSPADLDYRQGLKPLTLSSHGTRDGGTIILHGDFSDGITHSNDGLDRYGTLSLSELREMVARGTLVNGIAIGALYQHAGVKEKARVFCVSKGLTEELCGKLGFRWFSSLQEAYQTAAELSQDGPPAAGIIHQGGEVLPRIST